MGIIKKSGITYGWGGSSIQVSTMPTASEALEGTVYQYIGNTTTTFTHGYFYECVRVGSADFEWERRDTQPASGGSVPAGGTREQILAKVSDADGDADWVDDTGRELTRLDYPYGYEEVGTPIKKLTIGEEQYNTSRYLAYYKNSLYSTPEEFGQAYLDGKFDFTAVGININRVGGYSVKLPRGKATWQPDTAHPGYGSLVWADSNGITVPGATGVLRAFRMRFYPNATTDEKFGGWVGYGQTTTTDFSSFRIDSVVLDALGSNSFAPYERIPKYVHNLTGRVLEDLKISGQAIPTDWGVAKAGRLRFDFSSQTQEIVDRTIDISELGLTSADDYEVLLTITGGGTMDWGAGDLFSYQKTTTQVGVTYRNITSSGKDYAIVDYIIVAKGFGNNTMSGGGGSTYTAGEGIDITNDTISITDPTAKQVELTRAEYNALTPAEKTNGTIYFITDSQPSTTFQNYKVGEEVLFGTWEENGVVYDLYRKVIDAGSLTNDSYKDVNTGLNASNTIIKIGGTAVNTTSNTTLPLPHVATSAGGNDFVSIWSPEGSNNGSIRIRNGGDRTAYTAKIIIEFTRARS